MEQFDVAIIGGGPAGSTVGTLLRKYNPDLRVCILEREQFPRDHVGESQLPLIGAYLHEMGVWDKVEAAGFPIKVGATYRWGATNDLWNFEFLPYGELAPEPRPARYQGQRVQTAFQVDRAVYDKILLDHARELGCEVRERVKVTAVHRDGDRVVELSADSPEWPTVKANWYVDASGASGLLRRAMGVETESPTTLRNIAIWDYWQNATWAAHIGIGGTRVQVLSLGYGWIWFIPLGTTRTSVGLIMPAETYLASRRRPAELYAEALAAEPRIAELLKGAESENKLATTNDWSTLAERLVGENWFLAGDACGFADPILAAGMTLAHGGAREVAATILELERGDHAAGWLRKCYDEGHRKRIRQHIRFADYWYTHNAHFSELKEFTAKIAEDAGLTLTPDQAFQWLGTGGFANDDLGTPSIGAYSVGAVKRLSGVLTGESASWRVNVTNDYTLDLVGVQRETRPSYSEGRIRAVPALVKQGKVLPLDGAFRIVVGVLEQTRDQQAVVGAFRQAAAQAGEQAPEVLSSLIQALEAMIAEGWVKARINKARPLLTILDAGQESASIRSEATA
jgi:flavin-dependent dehydrogenase